MDWLLLSKAIIIGISFVGLIAVIFILNRDSDQYWD